MINRDATVGEVFSRCLRSRCPVCGRGRLFAEITHLPSVRYLFVPLERCDACAFRFGRQPGYYFGVVTPILPILALATGGVFAGVAYFGLEQDLQSVLAWGAAGIAAGFFLFFRTAIAVYVALDHAIDPPKNDASPHGRGHESKTTS